LCGLMMASIFFMGRSLSSLARQAEPLNGEPSPALPAYPTCGRYSKM
jgi:hypothetical protein